MVQGMPVGEQQPVTVFQRRRNKVNMMNRKPFIAALAAITVISWSIADSRNSDAQLLRRLRGRIQSRAIAPQPPVNQDRTPAQPNVPRYSPQQRPDQPSVAPRRVAPVKPAQPGAAGPDAKSSATRSPRTTGGNVANRPRLDSPNDPNEKSANQRFGQSILPGSNDAQENKASLGIQVVQSQQAIPGLEVTGFNPGSLATEAGLQVGDLIISLDGQPTTDIAAISKLLSVREGGDKVRLRIVRDRRTSAIDVPLIAGTPSSPSISAIAANSPQQVPGSERPAAKQPKSGVAEAFGLRYTNVDGQRGALVMEVEKGTAASVSGLKAGDRIVAVDGRLLVNAQALKQTLDQRKDGPKIGVRMVRDGKLLSAQIDPSKAGANSLAAGDEKSANDNQEKSALGGVGALLGGLLGGKPKQKPKDEMALGDDEGVRQVDFESEVAGQDQPPDPLSLEALLPPKTGEVEELLPPKQDSKKSPEQLKKEIEELERKVKELLKELEEKK
jgi:membrane-associated protease RseP (regulator of RpoE activity)